MLQNPSKYHPNPLSHFLALHHHQQAAHNGNAHGTLTAVQQHHIHQEQQQQQRLPQQFTNHLNHHHHHQQQQLNQQQLNATHTHLMDATTSFEAGKSFTIAAILGLQKSAIDSGCRDYNNVINLSLNNHNNNNNNNNSSHHQSAQNQHEVENNTLKNASNGSVQNNNCNTSGLQSFNCDTSVTVNNIGRYLPTANTNSVTSATSSFGSAASHHQQQTTNAAAQLRVNSFAAAAAVAAAAAANVGGGAPSALQSLQQLHQHHAQQSNLSFQRDKLKSDNNSKKSSLKNKRVRTIFTPEQLERLEAEFERQQYMVGPERLYLAHTLQLTEAQVKVWFQNRRIKWRKHHLEITQQRLALLRQSQLSATPVPNRTTTTPTCGDDAEDFKTNESLTEVASDSRQASDSDLSICNDSNDADSFMDGDET